MQRFVLGFILGLAAGLIAASLLGPGASPAASDGQASPAPSGTAAPAADPLGHDTPAPKRTPRAATPPRPPDAPLAMPAPERRRPIVPPTPDAPAEPAEVDAPVAGGAAPPDAAPPRGRVSKEAVREAVGQARPAIVKCYQQALTRAPDLGGRLLVRFTIEHRDGTGRLRDADIEEDGLENPFMGMCVLKALAEIEYPTPEGDGVVVVRYPFALSPD